MTGWTAKKFWTEVAVTEIDGGFGVALDARPVRTPLKSVMAMPTRAFAEAVAEEWRAVVKTVDPNLMPMTRAANSALDKVTLQRTDVVEMLAAYGESDLLCYRAALPEALVARQHAVWQPWLDWAAKEFGAPLRTTVGVIPIAQDQKTASRLKSELDAMTAFQLTGVHDLITISGSLVLALAVVKGALTAEGAWDASRLDELWQIEQWGADEEAEELSRIKRADFIRGHQIFYMA
jgi:chaperone required for assembly of F1-ATPase